MALLAFDTETTGLEPYHGDEMFMFSLCSVDGEANAYRLDRKAKKLERLLNSRLLKEFWTNKKSVLVSHNAKFDLAFGEQYLRTPFQGKYHCTLAMAWLLMNLHPHHQLKPLCWELGRIPTDDEAAIKGYGGYDQAPDDKMRDYAARDAFRHMFLYRLWWPDIKKDSGTLAAYKAEMDAIPAIMAMEQRGLRIDPIATKDLIFKLTRDVHRLERELHHRAGRTFNPDSPPQLRDVLFNKLKLPVLGYTDTGLPSTAKEYLQELHGKHKIIDVLMKFRSYRRAIPILEGYLDYADADDILHSDLSPTGALTGRMSSSRPNLQNVQKANVLRNPYAVPARRLFIAREGYTNYHFDYKGQELRLLVHYHKDEGYLEILERGGDAHREGVAEVFYGKEKSLIKKYRNAGKNGTFTIGYGGGAAKLSKTLLLPIEVTKERLKKYRERFPDAATFSRKKANEAKSVGYVRTELGRKIYINPEAIYTSTANALIQGTGAEIMKRAAARVYKFFKELDCGCHILLLIHDELIFEMPDMLPKRKKKEILLGVKERMEDFPMFYPPMEVDCAKSVRWDTKEEVKL